MAQRALEEKPALRRVLVCNDARMHEVYWGCFERSSDGLAVPATVEQIGGPGRVELPPGWSGAVHGAGSGFTAYPELRALVAGANDACSGGLLPRAQEIARLAAPEVAAGGALPAEQALPVYLRDEVARTAPDPVIKLTLA